MRAMPALFPQRFPLISRRHVALRRPIPLPIRRGSWQTSKKMPLEAQLEAGPCWRLAS